LVIGFITGSSQHGLSAASFPSPLSFKVLPMGLGNFPRKAGRQIRSDKPAKMNCGGDTLRFGSRQNFRDQSVVQATLMFDLHGVPLLPREKDTKAMPCANQTLRSRLNIAFANRQDLLRIVGGLLSNLAEQTSL
jgi:hypothetical protein